MAALAIATGALLTQSNLPSPGDGRTEKELAQLTDGQSTQPEQLVDDDYDVDLEEPVIDDRPKSLQEFAEDARTGGSSNAEPIVLGPMGELEPAQPGQSVIEWMGPR